jgi:putative N6-adenine-specific DNA methylase
MPHARIVGRRHLHPRGRAGARQRRSSPACSAGSTTADWFSAGDARQMSPPADHGLIVTNPPYGEQSTPRSASVPKMMGEIGDALKQRFAGWTAWLLTSDRQLPRQMRLAETRKTVLYNGALECRFFRFDLVSGSYRPRGRGDATADDDQSPAQSSA